MRLYFLQIIVQTATTDMCAWRPFPRVRSARDSAFDEIASSSSCSSLVAAVTTESRLRGHGEGRVPEHAAAATTAHAAIVWLRS